MTERVGVAVAVVSSPLCGLAAVATLFVFGAIDPVTIEAFRFGGGFVLLLPIALTLRSRWPPRQDWLGVALLGLMFFAAFFIVYNIALSYTTVAHATLALSTLPLLTMAVAAMLRAEPLTARKTSGVLIATAGVALALTTGLNAAPAGAWRGDLLMVRGTLAMAFYNVWSRPFIARSSPLGFVTAGMGCGGVTLALLAGSTGGFAVTSSFGTPQWLAGGDPAPTGGPAAVYLWDLAVDPTTPT